jgi:hypothetical protein
LNGSLTTVAHEAGLAVQHCNASRSDASTLTCTRSRCTGRSGTNTWDDALSKCVLILGWVGYSCKLGRGQALSARTGCCACNRHGPKYHHLICSWRRCLHVDLRPSFDSSLAMTQTTCAARRPFTTLANSIGNCSTLRSNRFTAGHVALSVFNITVTVHRFRSCSDPSEPGACEGSSIRSQQTSSYLPICSSHVSVARWC